MPLAMNGEGQFLSLGQDGQWTSATMARNPETGQELVYDGKAWQDAAKLRGARTNAQAGTLDNAVRAAAQGATFGFADELSAGADALTQPLLGRGSQAPTLSERYSQNLDAERGRDRAFAESNPVASIGGQIAGGVAGGVLATPGRLLQGATTLPQLMGRLGTLGAAQGAVGGFGTGEGSLEARVKESMQGAMLGGVAGAAAPVITQGVRGAVQAGRLAVSPEARAQRDVARAMLRDQTSPQALQQAAGRAAAIRPNEAAIADVAGENVRGLVERVAQTPGAARAGLVPQLEQRQRSQLGRIVTDLRALVGSRRAALEATTQAMDERASAARPLYERAMAAQIGASDDLARIWAEETQAGFGRRILNSPTVRDMLATEHGITIRPGEPVPLTMETVDAWKQAADDAVRAATRSGDANRARVIGQMRDRVLAAVDEANPAYAEARAAWAGPSKYMEAIEAGGRVLNRDLSPDRLLSEFRALSPSEQEGFRIGAVSAIAARMQSDPAKLGDMTKYLRSPAMREKIAALMPDDEAREAFQRALDFEVRSSELTGRALGNSATARRLAEMEQADDSLSRDVALAMLRGQGGFVSRLMDAIGAAGRRVRDTVQSRRDEAIAQYLMSPAERNRLLQNLEPITSRPALPAPAAQRNLVSGANALLNRDR